MVTEPKKPISWKWLKILYPIAMVPFSVSLWFVKTPINSGSGLDWKDFDHLRVICLIAAFIFWICSLTTLISRHRSFPLNWAGTILMASTMMVLPAPQVTSLNVYLQIALLIGLAAHIVLLFINDRCLPRTVKTSKSS